MSNWNPQANSIFLSALDLPVGTSRDAYVDNACAGDSQLRVEVVALLTAGQNCDDFLESSPVDPGDSAPSQQPLGDVVGPYRILQVIGEGGMGLVYMAEQTSPVQRQVALKVIKPGMDTRKVIARFEAERQALALMDHPNISKVFDAGETSAGRPFFVMELVKGVPITKFCDEQRLSVRERLKLFIPVCNAVQHAHQKGVIHRDLKPTNVMIALYDGVPVPKVIDFGVAKATGPKLTDQTMFTEFGSVIGTLEYMSPEQAELNQLDIDTRSDIYTLGVLLYELVSGTTPFEAHQFRSASFDEMRRMIREDEPPKPSTRLGSSDKLPVLAAQRALDAKKLVSDVGGDLDWIIMKAIQKERSRRYDTASAFSHDIIHFLADQPVDARPPTIGYRVRKFSYRYRRSVAAATVVAVALITGAGVSVWEAIRARHSEQAALTSEREAKLAAMAERKAKEEAESQRRKFEESLRFVLVSLGIDTPDLDKSQIAEVINRTSDDFQGLVDLSPGNKAGLLLSVGRACLRKHRYAAAERELRRCIEVSTDAQITEEAKSVLAETLLWLGNGDEGATILQRQFADHLPQMHGRDADDIRAAWNGLELASAGSDGAIDRDGLELSGDHSYVIVPNLQFDGRPPWTLEAMINPFEIDQSPARTTEPWTSLISTTDGGGIALESNKGLWSIGLYSTTSAGGTWTENYASAFAREKPELNRWQHIAGVWDGKELRIYRNGVLEETHEKVESCTQLSKGPFFIGADPGDSDHGVIAEGFFHGRIRYARISHGIEYIKNFPIPNRLKVTPETVGLYDFTIDSGKYAIDRSGHNHHGIIVCAHFVAKE